MTENAIRDTYSLQWDIFVTPSISYVSSYLPPREKQAMEKQAMWSPISSTLIYGKKDAMLVDTPITIEQTNELIDWIAASGKNLTTIYITHGHADHWFGIGALLHRFPKARAVATTDLYELCVSKLYQSPLQTFGVHGSPARYLIDS